MSRAAIRTLILVIVLLIILVVLFFLLRPSSPTQQSDTTTSEATSAQSQQKTIDLVVNGGTMTPSEITVNEGDRVDLRITSDSPLEFHLHGYDIEKEVEANTPTDLPFDATITGRFQVEDHNSDTELGDLIVQPR